ncbi:hypothetical protein ACHAXR_003269, partial [Thalassiosira sp. AJA248-18]
FFQLEREYILQALLGFQPKTTPSSAIFDPTDRSIYQGPPLPPRYANLILPSDWHIPGKTQRRKRIHRKSHGKIGFHELNKRISKSWQVVDDETRAFCTCLSEVDSRKYKMINKKKRKAKKANNEKKKVTSTAAAGKEEPSSSKNNKANKAKVTKLIKDEQLPKDEDEYNDFFASIDWSSASHPQEDVATMDITSSSPYHPVHDDYATTSMPSSPDIICRKVSQSSMSDDGDFMGDFIHEDVLRSHALATTINNSLRVPFMEEVDMKDDEIINMWKSINVGSEHSPSNDHHAVVTPRSSLSGCCQVCVEIPVGGEPLSNTSSSYSSTTVIKQEDEGEENDTRRKSFIDSEYEMFQKIGKQAKSNSILPGVLMKNSITASQA